jgi:predicted component of type VI protein secretion system
MQKEPINTLPLQKFLQQVKAAESSNQREVRMDMQTAKKLSLAISELSLRLNSDLEELLLKKEQEKEQEVITVSLDGGSSFS